MAVHAGYWVDLANYVFSENDDTTWIHAMPINDYYHPIYGDIKVTSDRIKAFADSVTNRIRGQDLDIDYDHKAKTDKAAGWVKAAEARNDGLWLKVQWTPSALKSLHDKEYRYFSPEFQDEWEHPSTRVVHKDVIFGGGLTNRPYMKGILPINMSELTVVSTNENERSESMFGDKKNDFIKKFGLKDDATDEEVLTAISDAKIAAPEKDTADDTSTQLSELKTQLAEVKKLAEADSKYAPMVAMLETQQKTLSEMKDKMEKQETAIRLSEIDSAVMQFSEKAKSKGYAVPPALKENVTKFFRENPKQFSDDLSKLFGEVFDAKLVKLGETKTRRTHGEVEDDDAAKKLHEGVKNIMKEDKSLSYSDALQQFAEDNPDTYEEYRAGSYANGRGDE